MLLARRTLLRAATAVGLIAATGRIPILAQPKPRIIPMRARKFTYEPAEVTLKLNEPVTFQLTSADVVMGFSVPDFKMRGTIAFRVSRTQHLPGLLTGSSHQQWSSSFPSQLLVFHQRLTDCAFGLLDPA